tara:strand:- start:1311 stop:1886 length:576 start_codon:yes stop_codon:yes gene_type:complete
MTTMLQHMQDRHVDLDLHTVWLDEAERVATYPLWDLSGQFSGYQAYRPDADKVQKNNEAGRYYTYRGKKVAPDRLERPNKNRAVAVACMESWYLTNTLFVTEGYFDAVRFTELGVSAVALLSNDPSVDLQNWLYCVRQTRTVVAVCDPGQAGFKLAKVGHHAHVVNLPNDPDSDLGDAPQEYVQRLVDFYG